LRFPSLTQASIAGDDNPFQALTPILMASKPPLIHTHIPKEWFEGELVKSFNFVLDTESDSCFPPGSRGFSYQRKRWTYTQYIHRSGVAFIQILPNSEGFYWVNNRLHLASTNVSKTNLNVSSIASPENLREQFQSFCDSSDRLDDFWAKIRLPVHY
jgi:hypothetical protein